MLFKLYLFSLDLIFSSQSIAAAVGAGCAQPKQPSNRARVIPGQTSIDIPILFAHLEFNAAGEGDFDDQLLVCVALQPL